MDNVIWLDNNSSTGMFVLKMHYANGGMAYMKNKTYNGIVHFFNLISGCPDIVDACIYNPNGEPVFEMNKHKKVA